MIDYLVRYNAWVAVAVIVGLALGIVRNELRRR